jgi:hypothetical protein
MKPTAQNRSPGRLLVEPASQPADGTVAELEFRLRNGFQAEHRFGQPAGDQEAGVRREDGIDGFPGGRPTGA